MSRRKSLDELVREEEERRKEEAETDRIINEIASTIEDDPKALARILYNLGCRGLWS